MNEQGGHGNDQIVRIGDVRIEDVRIEEAGRILIWQSGLAIFVDAEVEEHYDPADDEQKDGEEDGWEDWDDTMGIGLMEAVRRAVSQMDGDPNNFSDDEMGYCADVEHTDIELEPDNESENAAHDNASGQHPFTLAHNAYSTLFTNGGLHSLSDPDSSPCSDCRYHSLKPQDTEPDDPSRLQAYTILLCKHYNGDEFPDSNSGSDSDSNSDSDSDVWSIETNYGSDSSRSSSSSDESDADAVQDEDEERIVYLDDYVNHSDNFPRRVDGNQRCSYSYCRHELHF